jgi:hypothetical protein
MTLRLAGQSTKTWGIAGAVLALAVSGLFGGLQEAPKPPPAKVGTEIVSPAWKVTVLSARVIASHRALFGLDKTNQWIAVTARVELTANETFKTNGIDHADLSDVVRLTGLKGIVKESKRYGLPSTRADTIILKRDDKMTQMLQPGLPEELEFCWEQKAGSEFPAQLTIQVLGLEWRADSSTNQLQWKLDDGKTVEVVVPLQDQRATTKPVTP